MTRTSARREKMETPNTPKVAPRDSRTQRYLWSAGAVLLVILQGILALARQWG